MKITLLNHASVLIELGPMRLLTDPWYFGYPFAEGWGLVYDNPRALEVAATATHLWVSHFHGDHLNRPTLSALVKLNSRMRVFACDSANFQMSPVFRSLGFPDVVSMQECRPYDEGGIELRRFPATGIDNTLSIRGDGATIVNYNDCNLPAASIRHMRSELGPITLLLNNYNNAGKILRFPLPPAERIISEQRELFRKVADAFEAKIVIPFASMHYYRAEETAAQNASLMGPETLSAAAGRLVPLAVGQTAAIDAGLNVEVTGAPAPPAPRSTIARPESVDVDELLRQASEFSGRVRRGYFGLSMLLPSVFIHVTDLGRTMQLSPRSASWVNSRAAQMEAHSSALRTWFTARYGTDSFVVGAHLALVDEHLTALRFLILLAMLGESQMDFVSLIRSLRHRNGWSFWWNRRHEIWGVVSHLGFSVEESRL